MKKAVLVFSALLVVGAGALALIMCVPGVGTFAARVWIGGDWSEAQGRVVEIKYALEDFRADHGRYPTVDEGLRILLERPPRTREGLRFFTERYVLGEESLIDPWGRAVAYEVTEEGCAVYTLGRDGRPGGSRSDADFYLPCTPGL